MALRGSGGSAEASQPAKLCQLRAETVSLLENGAKGAESCHPPGMKSRSHSASVRSDQAQARGSWVAAHPTSK